jgi:hypothetical protein
LLAVVQGHEPPALGPARRLPTCNTEPAGARRSGAGGRARDRRRLPRPVEKTPVDACGRGIIRAGLANHGRELGVLTLKLDSCGCRSPQPQALGTSRGDAADIALRAQVTFRDEVLPSGTMGDHGSNTKRSPDVWLSRRVRPRRRLRARCPSRLEVLQLPESLCSVDTADAALGEIPRYI